MKLEAKQKAIKLRLAGASIIDIATKLGVSKGSVSAWVRHVVLEESVLNKIKARSHSAAAVEKRRRSRLLREDADREAAIAVAVKEVGQLSKRDLFVTGVALYWGEGSKKKRGVVEFTNSDPQMIKIMKLFFVQVCEVPEEKFRGHVYIHQHLNVSAAEKYWSGVSQISRTQFHKTSIQRNRKRVQKDSLPKGTFAIVICDTQLRLKIEGWMRGVGFCCR
jgi:transposase